MTDENQEAGGRRGDDGELIEIDLDFASMRRFQAEFSSNLSKDGLFIDTAEPLNPGSVVRFRVILPEEFVFLEGTAVVEWDRPADSGGEGAPGMALRFVTLSPQNQELVEQLVQDFIARGGTPFDLDYRPVPSDFPTDSLEGVAESGRGGTEPHDEAFRLSIRGTGPSPEEVAMGGPLVLPEPHEEVDGVGAFAASAAELSVADDAALDSDIDHGFDIVSGQTGDSGVSEVAPESEPEPATEDDGQSLELESLLEAMPDTDAPVVDEIASEDPSIGDPPELDWIDDHLELEPGGGVEEPDSSVESDTAVGMDSGEETHDAVDVEPVEESKRAFAESDYQQDQPGPRLEEDGMIEPPAATVIPSAKPTFLKSPEEFDSGPEVVGEAEIGGPAFDVSLPEPDDGPDTTPLLPDEGIGDVTLDYGEETPPRSSRRRSLRWLGLAAILVIVAAGAYMWPRLNDWLFKGDIAQSEVESSEGAGGESEAGVSGAEPAEVAETTQEAADNGDGSVPESGSVTEAGATTEAPEDGGQTVSADSPTDGASLSSEPGSQGGGDEGSGTAASENVDLQPARAIASIDVGRRNGATVVTLRGDGGLGEGAISMSTLPSPPRVIIRVVGITEVFRPYTINASTAELTTIRIGHHEERRPPELWVVLDVTDPAIGVRSIDIRGDTAELLVARD